MEELRNAATAGYGDKAELREEIAATDGSAEKSQGPSREALLKAYSEDEADALLNLEQKFDGRGDTGLAADPEAIADAVTAAAVYTNGT